MTTPYMGGQVASLLRQAKKQSGLLEDEDPLAGAPPAANPFQARSTSPMGDPNHAHRSGLLGTVQHALGTDRIAPELASLLTPEQAQRVRPGGLLGELGMTVLTGKGAQTRAQEEAMNLLGLQDKKVARDKMARDQRVEQQIQAAAGAMEPQAGAEYAARMRLMYGLPEAAPMAQATDQMRTPAGPGIVQVPRGAAVWNPQLGKWEIPSPIPDERKAPVDNAIVAIDDGNGNPVYVPRAEAIGKKPWRPEQRPTVTTARIQETYRRKSSVLDNLNKAIDTYRAQLEQSGVEIMPGPARSRLTGAYANLKLLAKEAAELGALTGPDVKILEELFNDPASIRSGGMNLLEMGRRKQSLLEQLDQYRAIINGNRATLEENYNREMALSGPSTPDAPAGKTITVNGKTFRLP